MSDCFEIFAAFFSSWAQVIAIWTYFNGRKNNNLDHIISEKKIENMITVILPLCWRSSALLSHLCCRQGAQAPGKGEFCGGGTWCTCDIPPPQGALLLETVSLLAGHRQKPVKKWWYERPCLEAGQKSCFTRAPWRGQHKRCKGGWLRHCVTIWHNSKLKGNSLDNRRMAPKQMTAQRVAGKS